MTKLSSLPKRLELSSGVPLAFTDPADDTVNINGYNGGPVDGWDVPIVIDLSGMKQEARMPVLLEHKRELLVGQVTQCTIAHAIDFATKFFDTPSAQTVRTAAANGLQYQASIGFDIGEFKQIGSKETHTCNGQTFTGPMIVVTQSTLREISCVLWGRDSTTSVKMSTELEKLAMKLPAELAELRQEFSDPAFVLEALDNKWALDDASKEWIKRERAKLEAQRIAQEQSIADERAKLEVARAEALAAKPPAPNANALAKGVDPITLAAPTTQGNFTKGISITMQNMTHKACAEPFMTHDDVTFYERYGETAVIHGKFDGEKRYNNFENLPW